MTHGSLFSGVGGFDLAAEWMGWENLFHCEINEWCQKVLRFHFPKSIQYDDITRTDFAPWRGKVDILTGGFPCQPFSTAGKRRGAEDDRYLWPEMLRAIREIRPAWVIGENVAGITSMVQPGSEVTVESQASLFDKADKETILEQEYVIETVCRDLEREGYTVQPILIPACGVGAPHRRDRVWFIARRLQEDCNKTWERNNCGHRRFRFSESVGLEDKQFGVCVQDYKVKGRWQEMENYLNAQVDLLCSAERRNRPYQQGQVRQQKVESEDSFTLGELTQPLKGNRREETKGEKQMVCANLREQPKISFGLLQHERGSDGSKNKCRENSIANRSDSGIESLRQGRENEIHELESTSHSNGTRGFQLGERRNIRDKEQYDPGKEPEWNEQPSRFGGGGEAYVISDTDSPRFQAKGTEQQTTGITGGGLQKDATDTKDELMEGPMRTREGGTGFTDGYSKNPWLEFPTQPPVRGRDDGLPFDVDYLAIPFTKWRQESIKAYGNAIVPQVAFEIFKAIETSTFPHS